MHHVNTAVTTFSVWYSVVHPRKRPRSMLPRCHVLTWSGRITRGHHTVGQRDPTVPVAWMHRRCQYSSAQAPLHPHYNHSVNHFTRTTYEHIQTRSCLRVLHCTAARWPHSTVTASPVHRANAVATVWTRFAPRRSTAQRFIPGTAVSHAHTIPLSATTSQDATVTVHRRWAAIR